jgi:hypothetical protein
MQYAEGIRMHRFGRIPRTAAWNFSATKDAVNSFLASDGRPISTSTLVDYNDRMRSMHDQFRERDHRLLFTVVPPYRVNLDGSFTDELKDRYFINLMASLPGNPTTGHRLPVIQFEGGIVRISPHITGLSEGGHAALNSRLGFYFWRTYHRNRDGQVMGVDIEDFPLFTVEEVMLNLAEAAHERGLFDQAMADATINRLRPRAGLPNMIVAHIDAGFDLHRDAAVDPVMWEIRRERRVELMGRGFRFDDLRRWRKGHYLNRQPLGPFVRRSDFTPSAPATADTPAVIGSPPANIANLRLTGGANPDEGFVYYFPVPLGWEDRFYLRPIPLNELDLNPNLGQNPGWD